MHWRCTVYHCTHWLWRDRWWRPYVQTTWLWDKSEEERRLKSEEKKQNKSEKTSQVDEKHNSTPSSGVMSQRQICPSWQPVMMVLKSSITRRLLMQWVGAVRPQSTMGRTRLFPDIMVTCLEKREMETNDEKEIKSENTDLKMLSSVCVLRFHLKPVLTDHRRKDKLLFVQK